MTVHVPSRSTGPSKTTEQQGRAANSTDNESLEVPASLGAKLSGGAIGSARALREVLSLNDVAIPPGASDAEVARLAETQRWPQQHQGTVQRVTARMLEPAIGPAPKADSSRAAVAQRAHLASGQLLAHNLHRRFEEGPCATGVGTATGGTGDGTVDAGGTSTGAGGTSTGAGGTRTTGTPPGAAAPPLSAQAAPMSMAAAPGETQDPEEPSVNASDPEGARNNLDLARTLWRENPSDPANIDRLEKAIADANLAGKPIERDTHADNMVELARQMRQDAAEAKDKARSRRRRLIASRTPRRRRPSRPTRPRWGSSMIVPRTPARRIRRRTGGEISEVMRPTGSSGVSWAASAAGTSIAAANSGVSWAGSSAGTSIAAATSADWVRPLAEALVAEAAEAEAASASCRSSPLPTHTSAPRSAAAAPPGSPDTSRPQGPRRPRRPALAPPSTAAPAR